MLASGSEGSVGVAVELMQISKKCVSWKRGIPNSRYKLKFKNQKGGSPKKGDSKMYWVGSLTEPTKDETARETVGFLSNMDSIP